MASSLLDIYAFGDAPQIICESAFISLLASEGEKRWQIRYIYCLVKNIKNRKER